VEPDLAAAKDFITRQAKAGQPFFCWWNGTRRHFRTHVKQEHRHPGNDEYTDGMIEHAVPAMRAADPKPSILYIVSDDHGWKDVGYHGSDIKTPTIDKLAAENPGKVAALQVRANELAVASAKSPLLQMEFQALQKRMGSPPAFPGEEFEFNQEP